jgi:hypothetical protein
MRAFYKEGVVRWLVVVPSMQYRPDRSFAHQGNHPDYLRRFLLLACCYQQALAEMPDALRWHENDLELKFCSTLGHVP